MRALAAMTLGTLLATPLHAGQNTATMHVSVEVIRPAVIQELNYNKHDMQYRISTTGTVRIKYEANDQQCRVQVTGSERAQVTVHCDAYAFPRRSIKVTPRQ